MLRWITAQRCFCSIATPWKINMDPETIDLWWKLLVAFQRSIFKNYINESRNQMNGRLVQKSSSQGGTPLETVPVTQTELLGWKAVQSISWFHRVSLSNNVANFHAIHWMLLAGLKSTSKMPVPASMRIKECADGFHFWGREDLQALLPCFMDLISLTSCDIHQSNTWAYSCVCVCLNTVTKLMCVFQVFLGHFLAATDGRCYCLWWLAA